MNTLEKIRKSLTPELLMMNPFRDHPLAGHCYIATEALYHLGYSDVGFRPKRAKDEREVTHWWLEHDGVILDVTAAQYLDFGEQPPYEKGVFGGFLTKTPCKRTLILMERVNGL